MRPSEFANVLFEMQHGKKIKLLDIKNNTVIIALIGSPDIEGNLHGLNLHGEILEVNAKDLIILDREIEK